MPKRIVVIASGETERRALPHLAGFLRERGIALDDVRIPPRNKALCVPMIEKLIKAAWYACPDARADKFVVVVDLDGSDPDEVLGPIREQLPGLVPDVEAEVLYAFAQQHLEAWFFADAENLRGYLGRALGNVDTSKPDEIENPKLHLRNLLGSQVYTARVSGEIAGTLDAQTIVQRSPSFSNFVEAVTNGPGY